MTRQQPKLISLFNKGNNQHQVICQGEKQTFIPNTSRNFFELETIGLLRYKGIVRTDSLNQDANSVSKILEENEKLKAQLASTATEKPAAAK